MEAADAAMRVNYRAPHISPHVRTTLVPPGQGAPPWRN